MKAQLAAVPDTEVRLILATGRYIGEGFDDARLDTLCLALPVSWKGTHIQYAGRLHRLHPAKQEVRGGRVFSDAGVSGFLPVQYSNGRAEIHEETKT